MTRDEQPRILFVGNNPGGINAFLPVARTLPHAEVALTTPVANMGASLPNPVHTLTPALRRDELEAFLQDRAPQMLITGTSVANSAGHAIEHWCRQYAAAHQIPSLTILDHWCNYVERFSSGVGARLDSLPDILCVMDERARQDMCALGFPPARIMVTGHPGFDALMARKTQLGDRPSSRDHDACLRIGFISEPIDHDYGASRGYTEHTLLQHLMTVLHTLDRPIALSLRLHPRDVPDKYHEVCGARAFVTTSMGDQAMPSDAWATSQHVVIGATSIVLLQAAVLGRTALSYQPGVTTDSPWARMLAPLPVLNHIDQLHNAFQDIAAGNIAAWHSGIEYRETHATDNVLHIISDRCAPSLSRSHVG